MEQKQALVYGFGDQEALVSQVLERRGIVPVIVEKHQMGQQVGYLCGLPGYRQKKREPRALPRDRGMLVFHNLDREELDELLKAIHDAGVTVRSLKAMVTPTNLNWTMDSLLGELHQEQQVMGELMKLNQLRKEITPDPFNFKLMSALIQAEKCFSGEEEITVEQVKKACEDLIAASGR